MCTPTRAIFEFKYDSNGKATHLIIYIYKYMYAPTHVIGKFKCNPISSFISSSAQRTATHCNTLQHTAPHNITSCIYV